MSPLAELPPITDERRLAVAQWVETNVRPVLHVVAEDAQAVEQPQQEFELRDYQVDAWANLDIAREAGRDRALGNLATGLGKTFVAGVDIMRYRERCASQDPPIRPRILYASHREDINDQAEAKTLRPLMPDATMTTFRTKRKNLPDADVTYATLKALHSELDRFDPDYFDYIVWDEGHHLEAETYRAVRDHFRPRFAHVITATLERMDGKDIQEYTGEPLYQKTLPEGIAEGYLADVDYHIVFDDIVKQLMEEGFEPKTLKEFHELFNVRPRNEVIAKNIREEQHKIGLDAAKTMVFCESVKHAEEMAELLGGTAYHSDLEKDDRKRIMREFREGSTQVICTVDMFNEGIDIPDARLIVFLRSTQSGTIFEQQLGRGLRKMLGKDKVSVLDFVANIERIAKVRELSRSIRQRSEELGQRNGFEEGAISGGGAEESGLRIHTQHGDFDFDKIAVDLLEKWGVLKETTALNPLNELSNDDIIALALQLKSDGPLRQEEIVELSKSKEFVAVNAITDRFGSLRAFHAACGFDVVVERLNVKGMTKDDIVALALQLSPEEPLGNNTIAALAKAGKFVSSTVITNRFSSMQAFREACGFTDFKHIPPQNLTKAQIVEWALSIEGARPLGSREMSTLARDKKFISPGTVKRAFGSMEAFYEACGFTANKPERLKPSDLSDEDIIRIALELKPDGPLTQDDVLKFSKEGKFVSSTIIDRRFGGFSAFQSRCGFGSNKGGLEGIRSISNDDLVSLARQLKPGDPLTVSEIKDLSSQGKFASPATITSRFGSIKAFQRACLGEE